MRIAELFVSLGFSVTGANQLATTEQNIMKAQGSALKLVAAVGAINAAFYVMMTRAVDAAVGLDQWRKATGESTDDLQRLQYGAARANVAVRSVADAVKVIQRTRAEIALGNVDASSPWFLLGIDPRQDPKKVLDQLRSAVAVMDPGLARNLVTRMGFGEDILYLLQQKKTLGSLFVTGDEITRLTQLGGAWKGFLFNISTVATKFAATFADGLARIIGWLEKGTKLMGAFVGWLNSGTPAANAFKVGLMALVVLLGLVALALTGIVGLLGALQVILIGIQLLPVVWAFSLFAIVLAVMAAALIGLVLLVQDFWTAIDGGKSLFDWNDGLLLTIKNVERLAHAIEWVIDKWTAFKNLVGKDGAVGKDILAATGANVPFGPALAGVSNIFGRFAGQGNNTKNVEINVHGAGDPIAVGHEVGRNVSRELSDAQGQAPLPTF